MQVYQNQKAVHKRVKEIKIVLAGSEQCARRWGKLLGGLQEGLKQLGDYENYLQARARAAAAPPPAWVPGLPALPLAAGHSPCERPEARAASRPDLRRC